MMNKIWYTVEDEEHGYDDLKEAINFFIEGQEDISYPISISVGKRMTLPIDGKSIIAEILENLDQEHSDPDGDYTKPTKEMLEASNKLAEIIKSQYKSFWIEPTGEKMEISESEAMKIIGFENE